MNRQCDYCGGWELGDGTEDADWNPCECDDDSLEFDLDVDTSSSFSNKTKADLAERKE